MRDDYFVRAKCDVAQMIVTDGGVGDLLAELVAVDYNIKTNPHVFWRLFCPDYLVEIARHFFPNLKIYGFSLAKDNFVPGLPTKTTEWSQHGHSPMRTHPVDYGFHMLADRHITDMRQKNYLQVRGMPEIRNKFDMPEKYVCIAATGAEPVKTLPGGVIDEISDYVLSRGYTPVYLGKKVAETGVDGLAVRAQESGADTSKGVNLIDKTSLLEAAAIIDSAMAWVGCDGGLMHLAGCTATYIVCGFTLVSPQQVAPIRNNCQGWKFFAVEPDEDIPNRYYQTNCGVMAHGDFRKFPGWRKVVDNLTADKFIKKLDVALSWREYELRRIDG